MIWFIAIGLAILVVVGPLVITFLLALLTPIACILVLAGGFYFLLRICKDEDKGS